MCPIKYSPLNEDLKKDAKNCRFILSQPKKNLSCFKRPMIPKPLIEHSMILPPLFLPCTAFAQVSCDLNKDFCIRYSLSENKKKDHLKNVKNKVVLIYTFNSIVNWFPSNVFNEVEN